MSLVDELLPASFRGVQFLVESTSTTGGRKVVTNEFPNSDRRFVEDLGLLNKTFSMVGILAEPNVTAKKNNLIRVLEKPGEGILIHPTFGVQRVTAKPYVVDDQIRTTGEVRFTLDFEFSQDQILPRPVLGAISNIFDSINEAIVQIQVGVIQVISITRSDNFIDALTKTSSFVATVSGLTNSFVSESAEFDEFSKILSNFAINTAPIVNDTVSLSNNIAGTFTSLDDALSTPKTASALFAKLFTFGDTDTTLNITTSGLIERDANRDRLNGSIQTIALLMSYRNAVQTEFVTVDEINAERESLAAQFDKVTSFESINKSNTTALQQARNQVREFFDRATKRAFKIIDVEIAETTVTELTYRYYGNLDNLNTIIDINNFKDLSHIKGTVKILGQ